MTPLQLLKQIQSKNYYHMNKIINRNVSRFFRFISPFLCIFVLVIIVLYISNNTYTAAFWRQVKNLNAAIKILAKKMHN